MERQLAFRCQAQFLTLSVKEEQHLPYGSDWPSIRKAGRNAAN